MNQLTAFKRQNKQTKIETKKYTQATKEDKRSNVEIP